MRCLEVCEEWLTTDSIRHNDHQSIANDSGAPASMDGLPSLKRPITLTAAILAVGLIPGEELPPFPARIGRVLRDDGMNRIDVERMERGYYESLLDAGRRFDALARPENARNSNGRAAVPLEAGPLADPVDDLREYRLKPGLSILHWGVRWTTNGRGMRDKPYATTKPENTLRIAFIGDSIGAGWGVDDGQPFEAVLERSLDERSRQEGGPSIEILNFAVPGHAPGQRWENFQRLGGWGMGPDLVLYEATPADPGWDERRLRALLPQGLAWDSPLYRNALDYTGVMPGQDADWYKRRLRSYRWEILAGVYRTIALDCRKRGVPSVWILIPRVGKSYEPEERQRLIALAKNSGFSEVIDLSDVYDGLKPADLAISPNDYHPNAEGHARLARRLEAVLETQPELRRILSAATGAETTR